VRVEGPLTARNEIGHVLADDKRTAGLRAFLGPLALADAP
jgi:hypothetical protein